MENKKTTQNTDPAITPNDANKDQQETIKKNPNPRANANIPDGKEKDRRQTDGVGSEITDGEGG